MFCSDANIFLYKIPFYTHVFLKKYTAFVFLRLLGGQRLSVQRWLKIFTRQIVKKTKKKSKIAS